MYQPATARWKSEDPFPPNGEPILLGRNPYEYAQNNPINRVDPSGLDSTPITVEGETYSVSESQDSFQNPGKGNRFILATGIAEDAKAVFVALAVQGAVYRQGRDAAQSVMSALQKKEGVGNFTTKDFLRAMFGVDPDRLAQPEGLTECEREALIAAQESFREYEKALQETNRLFDKLGFDKLQLEGYTRAGSFPGTSNRGTGFNTALDIVQQWVPDPRDYDGIQSADLEVEIASLFIPIPGIGRLAGLAGRAATGVAARLVPNALRAIVKGVLEFAVGKSRQFIIKPVSETTKRLLERMGGAGTRGLDWLQAQFKAGIRARATARQIFNEYGIAVGHAVNLDVPSAIAEGRSYITYVFRDASRKVVYVGRASGPGTPRQVLAARLAKGHAHLQENLIAEVVDAQGSKLASQGAEEVFIQGFSEQGAQLTNVAPSLGFSNEERALRSIEKLEAYLEDLTRRGIRK